MNKFIQEQWPMFDALNGLRRQVLDLLTDEDLAFHPGGQNTTFGALFRENGDVEYSYIQSIVTFKQDWSYHNPDPDMETSVDALRNWYAELDADLRTTVETFSDEDFKKTVDRGFQMPLETQLQAYIQALLIFLGKVGVYLRAMNKPLPDKMQEWIG